MKIIVEHYDTKVAVELSDASTADEAIEAFSRMLVSCGYAPNVIKPADGGRYYCEYKEEGEQ